jgi:hypothetical protein
MTGWIAISLGDATGIGPEVTLKALAAEIRVGFIPIPPDRRRRLHPAPQPGVGPEPAPGAMEQCRAAAGRFFLHDPLSRTAGRRSGSRFPPRRARRPGQPDRRRQPLFAPRNGRAGHRAPQQGIHFAHRPALHRPDRVSFPVGRHRTNRHDVAGAGRPPALVARDPGHHPCSHQTGRRTIARRIHPKSHRTGRPSLPRSGPAALPHRRLRPQPPRRRRRQNGRRRNHPHPARRSKPRNNAAGCHRPALRRHLVLLRLSRRLRHRRRHVS